MLLKKKFVKIFLRSVCSVPHFTGEQKLSGKDQQHTYCCGTDKFNNKSQETSK